MIERIKRRLQEAADLYRQMAEQLAKPTAQAAEVLIAALREGHTIYVCGDGGSAAQAQHVAGELVGRFMADRPALPCVALTTDTSVLTAVANDYSFEQVFERQVEALVREGDVLLLLSTSGSSANVLKAATRAQEGRQDHRPGRPERRQAEGTLRPQPFRARRDRPPDSGGTLGASSHSVRTHRTGPVHARRGGK